MKIIPKILILASILISNSMSPQGTPVFFPKRPGTNAENNPGTKTNCTGNSITYSKKYKLQSFYIPNRHEPLITLNITVHIFTKKGFAGYWENSEDSLLGIPFLNKVLSDVTNGHNERYSKKRKATYTTPGFKSKHIRDSKIQFVLTNVYFYDDTVLFRSHDDQALFNYIHSIDPNRTEEGMPIVFNGSGGPGHLSGYKGSPAVVTSAGPGYGFDFLANHLRHEIGHCFGLFHIYHDGSGELDRGIDCRNPDFLSDVFPSGNFNCDTTNNPCKICAEYTDPTKKFLPMISNNIMAGQGDNYWISPLQMARRRRALHLAGQVPGDLRKFVKETNSQHKKPLVISENETWDFDIQMYKDILVKKGYTLTVKCKIAMAKNGKIILEEGAKVIVDGGIITCWCKSSNWDGIQLKNKKEKISDAIVILNEGKIFRSENAK